MECLTKLATGAVSKLGDLVVESTVKHFKYLICHKKIIANLSEEHEKLKNMKEALQGRVDADVRKGLEIAPDVQKWLSEVEAVENELERFYEVNEDKKCFGGMCPDLAFNYSLSKQATKKIEDIESLKKENKFQHISYRKPPLRLGFTFTEDIMGLESRSKVISEVMEKLKDDETKRISICGMGGVGKTTLVKQLIKIIETSTLFDKVVMAVVSQNQDYKDMQSQIADTLDLKLEGESIKGRASKLLQKLRELDKVLIVLDDVWNELNFELIGLPSREHKKVCKILFTSRDKKVCQKMGSQPNFEVPVLPEDEAWNLFQEMAGDVVDKPDIHPIAKQVANECGGLPLAIVTIGRALGNEEKLMWEVALEQLRNSQSSSFSSEQEYVYSRIELSFNFLGSEEHKSCLLLCGLFSEDFDIPIESLLRHGMGLGLFEAVGAVWKVRNQVHALVNNLKRCFLLLDSNKPGCVKVHDVVRDVVLKIASREEHGFWVQSNAELKWPKRGKWDHIKAMSFILDETKELENGIECPKLKLLQVWSQSEEPIPWPENFIQGMSKLEVLALQNLHIPKMPSLLQASVNLHTLQVEGCSVGDISVIGKELKKLEILSFAHSNIEELPTEIGQLGFLRLLDLTECNDLNFISTNVLTRLSRLEELYFKVDNFPWMQNKDVLIELGSLLQHLKVVEIKVRKVKILPRDFTFKTLQKFWVYVVPHFNVERHGYLESNILQVTAADYKSIQCSSLMMQLVKKSEILILEKVENLKNVIGELDAEGLLYLKDLRVEFCTSLEYLVHCSSPCSAFPLIQSLSLKNLDNLREICNASNHSEVKKSVIEFSNLVELQLYALPRLIGFSNGIDSNETHQGLSFATELGESTEVEDGEIVSGSHSKPSGKLFSSIWMKQFPKLERILLQRCSSLEMVFDLQGYSQSNGQPLAVLFPQLKEVQINGANKLTSVWGNVPQFVQGFQNLRSLDISNCDSLSHVFTPVIAKEITKLENLKISTCRLMSNLVARDRDDEEDDNKAKEWPSLRKLEIEDCPLLEISLMPTQVHAKQDSLGVKSYPNVQDTRFSNFKENNSRINWPLGCTSLLSKFIPQGSKNKRSSKAVSLAQDHVPSIFEMKSKIEIGHMPILEDLYVRKCDLLDVLFLLEEGHNSTIPSYLKTIKIEDCDKLETIVAKRDERQDMLNSFAQLESLNLQKLPNLMRFCIFRTGKSLNKQEEMGTCEGDQRRIGHDPLIDGFLFPNLTSLFIQDCNNIGILFSHSSLRSLERLVKLEIRDCKNIEEIVSQEEIEANVNKIIFCGLQHLLLVGLPNLKAFCQGSYDFEFPSLREVRIEDCPNIEVFSQRSSYTPKLEDVIMEIELHDSNYIRKGDLNASIQGFKAFVELQNSKMLSWSKLKDGDVFGYFLKKSEMNVSEFHNLLSLVPFNETQKLRDLKQFTIENCDSLLEVFQLEGGVDAKKGDTTMHIIHYELQKMHLQNLPQLKHIWKHNITQFVSFSKLTKIKIINCDSLKSLLSHSLARSLEQLERLVVRRCEMMEEIVTKEDENNTEGGSKVKTLFPKLKSLKLEYLPKLERVCSGEYDYDLPLCDVGEDKEMNNKVEISFPELEELSLFRVPSLKCFCSGAYDYDLMLSSSSNAEITEECPQITTFPNRTVTVTVSTPNLHLVGGAWMRTQGDLNLTIHYMQNREKYMVELQKLDTFRCINQHLLGYITRETWLVLKSCDKLLNGIPSNMMHLFQHLRGLNVRQCGSLEEIFESDDYEGDSTVQHELYKIELDSLPKLRHIWKNHGPVLGFQNLEYLQISRCHDLKYVFHDVSIARSLPRLFGFEVRECNKMEEIIQNNNRSVQEQQPKQAKIIFPSMHWLRLKKLPSLNCFCPSSCYFELPQCKYITIEECPQMETFCYETLYTPGLFSLYVEGTEVDKDEEVNEVVQEIRQRKLESGG